MTAETRGIVYGARFREALAFASEAHENQVRKGNGAPYITHLLAVAALVGEYGGGEGQASSALLHEVVEDPGVAVELLRERFGADVARMVEAATDAHGLPKPPWRQRKEAHIARIRGLDARTRLVIAADKLHNTQSILRDLARHTRASPDEATVWQRFTSGRQGMIWYVAAMTEALSHGWEHDILEELSDASQALNRYAESGSAG